MTYTASLHLTEAEANRLAAAFAEDERLASLPLDVSEAAPGNWVFTAYLERAPGPVLKAVIAGVAKMTLAGNGMAFAYARLPETNWVKKSLAGLTPVRAERFLVHGRHDRGRRLANDIAIEIEAGEAFGTGHHGTTAGCLLAIDRAARSGQRRRPLDIGTGTGVLAIAMAKVWHVPVAATDIDPVAVRVAAENARLNGVADLVRPVVAGDLRRAAIRQRGPYDFVVANILAGPLQAMAPQIRQITARGGLVVLSGLLPEQRTRIVASFRAVGLLLERASVLDGWLTLVFKRGARNNIQSGNGPRPA